MLPLLPALQVPALRRIGMLPRVGVNVRAALADERVRRVLRQMGPAVLGVLRGESVDSMAEIACAATESV